MTLKYQLDSLDGLDESTQSLYAEKDGKYVLSVDGIPEPPAPDASLAERLAKLEANNRDLLEEKRKAKEEAERIQREAARKGGDIEALEKSWQEKLTARETELQGKLDEYERMVSGLTIGQAATKLAADVFGEHAELMMPHVNSRLTYEVTEAGPKVRVLDSQGKPTAATLEDLAKEFQSNTKFAPFVVGSRANGPGPHGQSKATTTKSFTELTGEELSKLRRENPNEYERLRSEHYGS